MPTFPYVKSGDPFRPSVSLENHLRRLVNESQSISGGVLRNNGATVRISVYNSTDAEIPAGSAVNFPESADDGELDDGIIPCAVITDIKRTFGVLLDTLEPNAIGSCCVSGPVKVQISDGDGDYVQPDINTPGVFNPSPDGVPVIFRQGSEAVINLGGGSVSGGATPYQFKVTDSSSYSVSGSLIKMQVTVSNGNDKENPIAGYLNKKAYAKTDLVLTSGIDTFYIYAINGEMYALKHQYASDLIPVLLCATVTVANGKLKIIQENFENNPEVPLCGESYGSVTLSVQGVVYADHTLTVKYGCSARALCNNLPIVSGEKSIPATAEGSIGYLIAYVEKLTVENDATPVTGFDLVSGSPTPQVEVEWYREVMSYTLTATGFRVISRLENPYLFTFTQVFLNAAELGH